MYGIRVVRLNPGAFGLQQLQTAMSAKILHSSQLAKRFYGYRKKTLAIDPANVMGLFGCRMGRAGCRGEKMTECNKVQTSAALPRSTRSRLQT